MSQAAPLPLRRAVAVRAAPNNLPVQLTSFVGREYDQAEIARLVRDGTRLLTLTGAGGVGKTRLALEVAGDLAIEFREGVWLVDLAPVFDPRRVLPAIATTLGIQEEQGRDLSDTLGSALRFRQVLLVLDNCEHVIDACAEFAYRLLCTAHHAAVLATSRESLNVTGETTWHVSSLSGGTAAQLFIDRAAASAPRSLLNESSKTTIAQICERLDGIPLALELAAARVPALGLEQIATRLDDRFRLLVGGSRMAPRRHQTLRAVVDWSYDLLADDELALFERLAVFAGGWSLEAAEDICGSDVDVLARLVGKSLVVVEDGLVGTRYRMLETMRVYAAEKLRASGAETQLRARHLAWFTRLAEDAERVMRRAAGITWAERVRSALRLREEMDNLRAAWQWSFSGGDLDLGLRLAVGLFPYFYSQGHLREGREWLAALLDRAPLVATPEFHAAALSAASKLAAHHGDDEAAACYATAFDALPADARSSAATTDVHSGLSISALRRGDTRASRMHSNRALELSRAAGDRVNVGFCLTYIGGAAFQEGAFDEARGLYQQALDEMKAIDFQLGAALALEGLANVARAGGEPSVARQFYQEALTIFRDMGAVMQTGQTQVGLGYTALDERDYARAANQFSAAAELLAAVGQRQLVAAALDGLARAQRGLSSSKRRAETAERDALLLTTREVEVARLLGEGHTNREIADRLVISVRTADRHVENIMARLGLRSRGAIAAWAAQHGLLPLQPI